MRTTLNIQDDLLKEAMRLADMSEKTAVVHMALQALVEKLAQKNLIQLGGKIKGFKKVKRSRT